MTNVNHNYCLILAGGVGSRLWPVSTEQRPKQFLDLLCVGRSMLQVTYERIAAFIPRENIFVSTNVQYLPLVHEQLPEVDDVHILEEPIRRGSLASVVWGMTFISHLDSEAAVLVSPTDQLILREEVFRCEMLRGLDYVAKNDCFMVVGLKPLRAETGYGYIQKGDDLGVEGVYGLKTFTEKPAPEFAKLFVEEGDFLWNTGLHMFRAEFFIRRIFQLLPEYQMAIPRMMADAECDDALLVPEVFMMLPMLGLDRGVLERCADVCVLEGSFGWSDMGTWNSIHDDGVQDARGNVLVGTRAELCDCSGNTVCLPSGRRLVAKGLHDYVVVEQGDTLLVCPRADVLKIARRGMLNDSRLS